jgi:hypothetical protein
MTLAFEATTALRETVKSFRYHPKPVRDLMEELEALKDILASLISRDDATNDTELSALDLPLLRCGNACKGFEQEIIKFSSRSSDGRTKFRDWSKLRYMGDDIDGFRRFLGRINLTIKIALADTEL